MITDFHQFFHIGFLIRRCKHMIFFSHLFPAKAGFIKPAGRGSADKGSNHRVQRKHGKRLLCQQHMTARVLLQFLKNPEIFF